MEENKEERYKTLKMFFNFDVAKQDPYTLKSVIIKLLQEVMELEKEHDSAKTDDEGGCY